MFVEKRFFEWKDDNYVDPIKLGDEISELLDAGVIIDIADSDENEYRLANDEDIWIGESDGKVNSIYYTKSKGDKLIGVNVHDLAYPATETVCGLLSKRFDPIPEITSIEQLRETRKGDFLYVIFRDFFPSNLLIVRISDTHNTK